MSGIFNPGVFNHGLFNVGTDAELGIGLGFASRAPLVDFVLPAPSFPRRLVEVYRPTAPAEDTIPSEMKELTELFRLYTAASRSLRTNP